MYVCAPALTAWNVSVAEYFFSGTTIAFTQEASSGALLYTSLTGSATCTPRAPWTPFCETFNRGKHMQTEDRKERQPLILCYLLRFGSNLSSIPIFSYEVGKLECCRLHTVCCHHHSCFLPGSNGILSSDHLHMTGYILTSLATPPSLKLR